MKEKTSRDAKLKNLDMDISHTEARLATLKIKRDGLSKKERTDEESLIIKALSCYDMVEVLNTEYMGPYGDEMLIDAKLCDKEWGDFPDLVKLGWRVSAFRAHQDFYHKGKKVNGSRFWLKRMPDH